MIIEPIESKKDPAHILHDDILKFTRDMDSLYATFPHLLQLLEHSRKNTDRNLHDFIKKNTTIISEIDKLIKFTVPQKHAVEYDIIKRKDSDAAIALKLIPRHFTTSLVSQYDSFLGCIVKFLITVKPELFNLDSKEFTYRQLKEFSSLDEAYEHLIEKEVETFLRKSHAEQFSSLEDKTKRSLKKNLDSWPTFIELTERRNLFAHCDGKVSSQYIKICSDNDCKLDASITIGSELNVDQKYISESYKCIYEIGFKLAHVILSVYAKDALEDSDANINSITFELIKNGEYDLAIKLLEFFTTNSFKHYNEYTKSVKTVNLAQAYKWVGNKDALKSTLLKHDWTACADVFKLTIAVLEDKFTDAYSLMKKLKNDSNFSQEAYHWPIFQELRRQPEFASTYKECYKEPFNQHINEDFLTFVSFKLKKDATP